MFFQSYSQYAFSAKENITLSDRDNAQDKARIDNACFLSGVDKLAIKWENGLDSFLTKKFEEDGEELSGGEWQKLALARAFFRNSKIIILDEPTSALDPESEYMLFNELATLYNNKGALFISHRLSNVVMADRILVIEGGEVSCPTCEGAGM